MYKIFCDNLTDELRNVLKASVTCCVRENTLQVKIYAVNDIVFSFYRKNLHVDILNSVYSQNIANVIVKQYRKYINNLFFK